MKRFSEREHSEVAHCLGELLVEKQSCKYFDQQVLNDGRQVVLM
jgi:hypothetical protein